MSDLTLSPRITELLVSHICHDLVSPVGAISNGVEFVEEMGADATPDALNLIGASVRQASARLQCFRLAYGGAGSNGNITYDDIRTAFGSYIEGGRVRLDWEASLSGAVLPPNGYMKVLLNTLMLVKEAVPIDGEICVENLDSGNGVCVAAKAARVEFKDGVESAYLRKSSVDELTPRTVHAYLTGIFAEFFGIGLELVKNESSEISFAVTWPQ